MQHVITERMDYIDTPVGELDLASFESGLAPLANDILIAHQRGGSYVPDFIPEEYTDTLNNHLFRKGRIHDSGREGFSWEYRSGQAIHYPSDTGTEARNLLRRHYMDQVAIAFDRTDTANKSCSSNIFGYAGHYDGFDADGLPWHFDSGNQVVPYTQIDSISRIMGIVTLHGYAMFEYRTPRGETGKHLVGPGGIMLIDYAKAEHRVSGPLFEHARTFLSMRLQ